MGIQLQVGTSIRTLRKRVEDGTLNTRYGGGGNVVWDLVRPKGNNGYNTTYTNTMSLRDELYTLTYLMETSEGYSNQQCSLRSFGH